jgi:hypothetical protein
MSPENCLATKPNILKDRKKYLHYALDECNKIINSLEKHKEILEESKKIAEKIDNTSP